MVPKKPIFVVGHPRSGTSLFAAMLDRHSKVAVPPETSYFFSSSFEKRFFNTQAELIKSISHVISITPNISVADIDIKLMNGRYDSLMAFNQILKKFAEYNNKQRWAEKSPWHLRKIPEIINNYPDARIVIILRDGRDCAESCVKAKFLKRSREWYLTTWLYAVNLGKFYLQKYPTNTRLVTYEDLIYKPAEVFKSLRDFLSIDYEENQLDHTRETNTFSERNEPHKNLVNKPLDSSRVYAWKAIIDNNILATYHFFQGKMLKKLNYPMTEFGKLSVTQKAYYKIKAGAYKIIAYVNFKVKDILNIM